MTAGGIGQARERRARGSATRNPGLRAGGRDLAAQRNRDDIGFAARTASARIAGEGYCAVPSSRRERDLDAVKLACASASLPWRDDLDPVAVLQGVVARGPRGDEMRRSARSRRRRRHSRARRAASASVAAPSSSSAPLTIIFMVDPPTWLARSVAAACCARAGDSRKPWR